MSLSVISANRLTDGVAVWLNEAGDWVERVDGAAVFDDAALDAARLQAAEGEKRQIVVAVAEAPVRLDDQTRTPLTLASRAATAPNRRCRRFRLRRIRAAGPMPASIIMTSRIAIS